MLPKCAVLGVLQRGQFMVLAGAFLAGSFNLNPMIYAIHNEEAIDDRSESAKLGEGSTSAHKEMEDDKTSGKLIPSDAPQWVKSSPVRTRAGGVQFPVRITHDLDSPLSSQEYQEQLYQEILLGLDELRIVKVPINQAVKYFPGLASPHVAENFARIKESYNSESELGEVRLGHEWRLVEIKSKNVEEFVDTVEKQIEKQHLWRVAAIGISSLLGISGCAAVGAVMVRGGKR